MDHKTNTVEQAVLLLAMAFPVDVGPTARMWLSDWYDQAASKIEPEELKPAFAALLHRFGQVTHFVASYQQACGGEPLPDVQFLETVEAVFEAARGPRSSR